MLLNASVLILAGVGGQGWPESCNRSGGKGICANITCGFRYQIYSIKRAEDRELFKETMEKSISRFRKAPLLKRWRHDEFACKVGFLIVRPAYFGRHGGIAER